MQQGLFQNLKHKIFGDARDQRRAVRDAGFASEAEAAAWAWSLLDAETSSSHDLEWIRKIRQERPDLSLRTATYIVKQAQTRSR